MMAKTSSSEPPWDRKSCLQCGAPANIGYDGPFPSMACAACAAGLFQVIAQSRTVLVPLPDATTAPSPADTPPADTAPRATRQPRPRVRRVPLYEPLTDGLRRRSRRDS
jgi:hypothetical protein